MKEKTLRKDCKLNTNSLRHYTSEANEKKQPTQNEVAVSENSGPPSGNKREAKKVKPSKRGTLKSKNSFYFDPSFTNDLNLERSLRKLAQSQMQSQSSRPRLRSMASKNNSQFANVQILGEGNNAGRNGSTLPRRTESRRSFSRSISRRPSTSSVASLSTSMKTLRRNDMRFQGRTASAPRANTLIKNAWSSNREMSFTDYMLTMADLYPEADEADVLEDEADGFDSQKHGPDDEQVVENQWTGSEGGDSAYNELSEEVRQRKEKHEQEKNEYYELKSADQFVDYRNKCKQEAIQEYIDFYDQAERDVDDIEKLLGVDPESLNRLEVKIRKAIKQMNSISAEKASSSEKVANTSVAASSSTARETVSEAPLPLPTATSVSTAVVKEA